MSWFFQHPDREELRQARADLQQRVSRGQRDETPEYLRANERVDRLWRGMSWLERLGTRADD